jgi:hypothetical protein
MFEDQQPSESELASQINSGANWFFWIAGLSLVNSAIIFFDGDLSFAIGLGITQIFDGIAKVAVEQGTAGWIKVAALVLDLVVIGIFIGFGFLGRARHVWAFILGIALFALDSIIFLLAFDILGIAIHAVALFFIVRGMLSARTLNANLKSNPAPVG